MEFTVQSELMEDRKQATVMTPGQDFQVIQTPSGMSIFFSIGTDNVLYVTREVQTSSTGWSRADLSSALSANHNGREVTAKSFCVAQNPQDLSFDLALVVHVGSSDYLYVSHGNTNTDEAWLGNEGQVYLQFTLSPFDAKDRSAGDIEIADVYLVTLPKPQARFGTQVCFVDVLRGSLESNKLRLLDRYYIFPGDIPHWNLHTLPIDLRAGSIQSCLGCRNKDRVSGMYTFGTIDDRLHLIFAPAYNFWDPTIPPSPARLVVPAGACAIASAMDRYGHTSLFVAAKNGVFVFPPDRQKEGDAGNLILSTAVVAGAVRITVKTCGDTTSLYGVNPSGDLFYTSCRSGSETSPEAWSVTAPLVSQIDRYAFYLNQKAGNNVLFAHTKGEDVLQLTQDPVTKDWASRSILLPSTDINAVIQYSTFKTRLAVTDSNRPVSPDTEVLLAATSPVGVYLNESYHVLNPSIPIRAKVNNHGVINIDQPTQDSVAIAYRVAIAKDPLIATVIDPGDKARQKIANLQSKEDLDNAMITLADGSQRALVPAEVEDDAREAAISALKQLVQVSESLPPDGSPISPSIASLSTEPCELWFDRTISSKVTNVAVAKPLVDLSVSTGPGSIVSSASVPVESGKGTLVLAGDLFRSLIYSTRNAVKGFVLLAVDDIYEVIVTIGESIYRAVLDCLPAVSHAIEWVFEKIKVGWEALKSFLGFVFNWKDIVRTKKVFKNIVYRYSLYGLSRITDIEKFVAEGLDYLEDQLIGWAGIPDNSKTMGSIESSTVQDNPRYSEPQTHYLNDKLGSNIVKAKTPAKSWIESDSSLVGVLQRLKDVAVAEGNVIPQTIDRIKTEIIEKFNDLTPIELVKRLLAIVGGLVLKTAKNIITATLEVVKDLGTAVVEALNQPIEIPIISALYREVADEELSILDLISLVAAVPSTLLYEAVVGKTLFPDTESTQGLIDAEDFTQIQVMINNHATYKRFAIISEFVAMSGLLLTTIVDTIKIPYMLQGKPENVHDVIKQISVPVRILVIMPSLVRPRKQTDGWEDKMNDMMTDLALMKVCLDTTKISENTIYGKVSPFVDFAISAIWIVPSVGRVIKSYQKASSLTTMAANLAYDVAIMTTPLVWSPILDPGSKLIMFTAANGVVISCSAIHVATAGLLYNDD